MQNHGLKNSALCLLSGLWLTSDIDEQPVYFYGRIGSTWAICTPKYCVMLTCWGTGSQAYRIQATTLNAWFIAAVNFYRETDSRGLCNILLYILQPSRAAIA